MAQSDEEAENNIFARVGEACACANIRRAARVTSRYYDEYLKPSGLLVTQYILLGAIGGHGEIAVTPLAHEMGMDPTTLGRNLKPLQQAGWVEISSGEDRRVRLVRLTELGTTTWMSAFVLWEEAQKQVEAHVGAQRVREMVDDWNQLSTYLA